MPHKRSQQLCGEIDTDAETGTEMNYFNCEALSVKEETIILKKVS